MWAAGRHIPSSFVLKGSVNSAAPYFNIISNMYTVVVCMHCMTYTTVNSFVVFHTPFSVPILSYSLWFCCIPHTVLSSYSVLLFVVLLYSTHRSQFLFCLTLCGFVVFHTPFSVPILSYSLWFCCIPPHRSQFLFCLTLCGFVVFHTPFSVPILSYSLWFCCIPHTVLSSYSVLLFVVLLYSTHRSQFLFCLTLCGFVVFHTPFSVPILSYSLWFCCIPHTVLSSYSVLLFVRTVLLHFFL